MLKNKTFQTVLLLLLIGVAAAPVMLVNKRKNKEEGPVTKEAKTVRRAAVAGTFYPGEKISLEARVGGFLDQAETVVEEGKVQILIVPHAGYDYSGRTAAAGFKQLGDSSFSTVVLLGSSHQAWFSGGAIDENDAWTTPLGEVRIDKSLAEQLVDEVEGLQFSSSAHEQEHSLEVELPFLQQVLGEFKIVPILLGQTDGEFINHLTESLAKNISGETLVVVSTDLSHYPPYEVANEVDRTTVEAIVGGEAEEFEKTINNQMAAGYSGLETCACGYEAVKVGMQVAQKLGQGEWQLIKYENSGDTAGDKSRVVGYASVGFYVEESDSAASTPGESLRATPGESARIGENISSGESARDGENTSQKELLRIARLTLEEYLASKKIPEFEIDEAALEEKLGAFVTLRKDGQLRGCIGQIEPSADPLWHVVRKMAIEAALKDTRFPVVRADELDDIEIEVSVLTKPEKINDPYKIELGRHGVIVKKGLRSGVFLPQVATETGWDLKEFMGQLCSQKTGLSSDCWKKGEVDIYTFEAEVFEERHRDIEM